MTPAQKITRCRVIGERALELTFADGFSGRLALDPVLWGPVFEPLHEPAFFRKVKVEDDTIRWPNEADFAPEVLRAWCEAGRVLSPEETDACFPSQTLSAT